MRHAALAIVLAYMVALALIRLRIADVPLERDEGEYAYAAQLILQGIPPFQLAYNMKFPGTYYAYSAMLAVFGQTAWGVHAGLMLINAATIVILFFLARRLLKDPVAAAVTAIAYGVLSIDRWTLAIFGHATHFVVLAAMAGLLVLLRAIDSGKAILFATAGVLFGLSILMKQNGLFFLALGMGIAAWSAIHLPERRLAQASSRAALVGAAAAATVAILAMVLYTEGVFGTFWFWTMQYGGQYAAAVSLADAWTTLKMNFAALSRANLSIWLLSLLGFVLLFIVRWPRPTRILATAFLLLSALAVCPGFYFRQHYFILLLPAIALFCGIAVASLERLLSFMIGGGTARAAAVAVFLIAVGMYARTEWDYLFSITGRELSRSVYGGNPFVESPELGRYLQAHTDPGDSIAVLGSEPQIYFYANRKSATGYIYTYALMEQQPYSERMQEEMIAQITAAHPKYIVFAGLRTSWLGRNPRERILTWSDAYLRNCYRVVGIADILSSEQTEWRWDDQVTGYEPRSQSVLYTLARNSDQPCAAPQ
jgi:4-amino-4-deoxy-L-arabinose transferase-like glycosyltransferase